MCGTQGFVLGTPVGRIGEKCPEKIRNSRQILQMFTTKIPNSEPPIGGRQKLGHPISSNFLVFFRFALLVFGNLFRFPPICSDLFRLVFRINENKSGKPLSADPFYKSPTNTFLQSRRVNSLHGLPFSWMCSARLNAWRCQGAAML